MKLLPFLQDLPIFKRLGEHDLAALTTAARLFEYPEGYRFSEESAPGQCAYLLVNGRVRVFQHDALIGEVLGVGEIGAGEMFNLPALVERLAISSTAVALESSVALELSRAALVTLRETSPRTALRLQHMIAVQLATALHARNSLLLERLKA